MKKHLKEMAQLNFRTKLAKVKLASSRAFTLVEVMIVVSIIALITSIAIPNVVRSLQRSKATNVKDDLRNIEAALAQYSLENNVSGSVVVTFNDLRPYFKTGSRLATSGNRDILGNSFNDGVPYTVDALPRVSAATVTALSSVTNTGFWEPYQ